MSNDPALSASGPTSSNVTDPAPEEADPRRWQPLAVIAAATLPKAQAALGVSDATREWVVTAYTVAYIRWSASMPSMSRPEARTLFVARHNASREARTSPSDLSTGHCS